MTTSELRHRLAAILVADVVGYSRLMAGDQLATLTALDAARSAFQQRIAASQGQVVDMAGDSVLAVFETATGAVAAALAVQKEINALADAATPNRALRFRIGVHLGDVVQKPDGSIYGDGVNIAARLEALADPGAIAVSDAVRGVVQGKVAATFQDQGEQKVKNIATPVRTFAVRPLAVDTGPVPAMNAELQDDDREPATSLPDRPSIVVLPFDNLSADADQEYFADGMVEDIITDLSRFQRLFVIARNTSFTYKRTGNNIKQVAAELGVHFVLEGSVRKAGNRIRVSAQLIEGKTGHHVWAERYEDVLSDVFELQERITRQVVTSMVGEIEAEEVRLLESGRRTFSSADDTAWRALRAWKLGAAEALPAQIDESIRLAEQAIGERPNCELAWYALGAGHMWRIFMSWTKDRAGSLAAALRSAEVLMQLAPNDSRSYFQRAMIDFVLGKTAGTLAYLRQAQALNPNDALVLFYLAQCEAAEGNVEQARNFATQAKRLSPRDRWLSNGHLAMAMCAFIEGDLAQLHDWAALAIQAQPSHPIRRVLMIAYAAEMGDDSLLRTHVQKLNEIAPDFIPSLFRGDFKVFGRDEHMSKLLLALRSAGLGDGAIKGALS